MEPSPHDLTAGSGSPTDVSPLGQSAVENALPVDWSAIAGHADFKALLRDKMRFIVPTTVFFVVYYFALPVLVGWFPELMKTRVGGVNYAYLFALSQFFMAWIVAGLYVVRAAGWDKSAARVLASFHHR